MAEPIETNEQEMKHDLLKKRLRHRKKLLYANIRKQMEFYFSDANISKDRFLGELTKVDPFVPVDTFLKFNKIRALTQDLQDIVKAIKHSEFLELSEDRTKVQRKVPFQPYDADSRTVYVESLPVTANQDWLERVFRNYGHVAYISLPKFKNSSRIKGYAFIEYDKPEEAQNCIIAFTKMGCKLSTNMVPDELSTIKMFAVEEPPDSLKPNNKNQENNDDVEEPPKKKIKKKDRKKSLESKHDSEMDSDAEKKVETPVEEPKLSDIEISNNESKGETSPDESNTEESKKKNKKRKRRKEHKNHKNKDISKDALRGLQILSKCEWKKLRNKYLNMQRKNMSEFKKQLRNNGNYYKSIPAPSVEVKPDITKGGDIEKSKKDSKPSIERLPGLFVKTVLPEPCTDIRDTKRKFRTNIHVQYVDVKEGQTEVILRFDTAEAAIQYSSITDCRASVLTGHEEQAQWSAVETGGTAGRARGRDRLVVRGGRGEGGTPADPQPSATHVRFDDV